MPQQSPCSLTFARFPGTKTAGLFVFFLSLSLFTTRRDCHRSIVSPVPCCACIRCRSPSAFCDTPRRSHRRSRLDFAFLAGPKLSSGRSLTKSPHLQKIGSWVQKRNTFLALPNAKHWNSGLASKYSVDAATPTAPLGDDTRGRSRRTGLSGKGSRFSARSDDPIFFGTHWVVLIPNKTLLLHRRNRRHPPCQNDRRQF